MKLQCPHCGVTGSADDSYLGRKVKCPKCQDIFVVADDSSAENPKTVASFSTPAATPAPASSPAAQREQSLPPVKDDGDDEESGPVAALATEPIADMLDFADDDARSGPAMVPPAGQVLDDDSFNLDDIAAEIEMQMAAAEAGGEPEEIPEGSPVDIGSLEDEFDQPTTGTTVAPEIAAIAANYAEHIAEDAVQLVEEHDTVVPEPVQGIEEAEQPQCEQCGRKQASDESFMTSDGQFYCPDCAPVADALKTADVNRAQPDDGPDAPPVDAPADAPEAPAEADKADDEQFSFAAAVKKIWTKIKGALFS